MTNEVAIELPTDIEFSVDVPSEAPDIIVSFGSGSGGADAGLVHEIVDEAIMTHKQEATPHEAYDIDMPRLSLIFENGLI